MKQASVITKIFSLILFLFMAVSCSKEINAVDPSENLRIDSIVATRKTINVWEEIYITCYASGQNINYQWNANHGSMVGKDSITAKYWACHSCLGLNTVECRVTNEFGTIADTIMILVYYER